MSGAQVVDATLEREVLLGELSDVVALGLCAHELERNAAANARPNCSLAVCWSVANRRCTSTPLAAVVTLAPADCSDDCSDCPKLLKSKPAISLRSLGASRGRSDTAARVAPTRWKV